MLLLDTYEALAPLDGWLREVFLPELPDQVLIVTAGRQPLAAAWHADPGWQVLLRELPLRVLSREESRAYLAQRNVAAEQHDAALAFTRVRARIVQQAAGADAGEGAHNEAVRTLLREAAAQLEAMPREQKLYRALHRAYLKPAPSQEQAAEALDLPLSTFRRHLKAGVLWVADYLWQRETGAPFAVPAASAK